MDTKPIRLMAVVSVPEGKAHFQGMLSELSDLFLAESQELEIVGIAYNKRTAIQQIERSPPDVLLIDVTLLGLRSIEIISYVSGTLPDVKILGMSPGDPPYDRVILALQAGALGFVSKESDVSEVFDALKKVLRGDYYLPIEDTVDVMKQAAPELMIAAKERRGKLTEGLLTLVPIIGIIAAFTQFLWRKYWGFIGVRVSDLGVDASSRVTDFLIFLLVLIGIFGPLMFIRTWMKMIRSWVNTHPKLNPLLTKAQKMEIMGLPIGIYFFGYWVGWVVLAIIILSITLPFEGSGGKILTLIAGIAFALILLAHVMGSNDFLPRWLTIAKDRVRGTLSIISGLVLTLLIVLTIEVFEGPDLRPDGLHGFLAPKAIGLSARPAIIHDLDDKYPPLQVLYLGGNADLYVLYDPCEKIVRMIPVGSSRVKMIKKVECASQ
jgi:DNA-binding NarL/FixJ family response regulator